MVRGVDALLVTNENLCATVLQSEVHFVFGPPCIERHVDCAHRDDGCKRNDPFGIVTHCNGNAVTLLDAVLVHQQVSQTIYLVHHIGKRETLTFVEKKCFVAVSASALQYKCEVLWRVLEDFHLHAEHFLLHQLERSSGSRIQNCVLCVCPRQCHVIPLVFGSPKSRRGGVAVHIPHTAAK